MIEQASRHAAATGRSTILTRPVTPEAPEGTPVLKRLFGGRASLSTTSSELPCLTA